MSKEQILTGWNYRVIKHDEAENPYFAMHEVYYDEIGDIEGWTIESVNPEGDTSEELSQDLDFMIYDAKNHPVLLWSELEKTVP